MVRIRDWHETVDQHSNTLKAKPQKTLTVLTLKELTDQGKSQTHTTRRQREDTAGHLTNILGMENGQGFRKDNFKDK